MNPKNDRNQKNNRNLPCDGYYPDDGDGTTRKGKLRRQEKERKQRGNPRSQKWNK